MPTITQIEKRNPVFESSFVLVICQMKAKLKQIIRDNNKQVFEAKLAIR